MLVVDYYINIYCSVSGGGILVKYAQAVARPDNEQDRDHNNKVRQALL